MRAELFCYNFSRFFPSILFSLNTFCFAFLFLLFALFSNKKLKKTKTWRSQLHYEYFLFLLRLFVSITLRLMSRFLGFGVKDFKDFLSIFSR